MEKRSDETDLNLSREKEKEARETEAGSLFHQKDSVKKSILADTIPLLPPLPVLHLMILEELVSVRRRDHVLDLNLKNQR